MIGLALWLAAQTVMGVTPQGQVNINQDASQGPPDLYLQDDIYEITGQHLCDRRVANKKAFDNLYRRRLDALERKLISIFGKTAMARDIIGITSCRTFVGEGSDARRKRTKQFQKRRAAFALELVAWEQFAAARSRN